MKNDMKVGFGDVLTSEWLMSCQQLASILGCTETDAELILEDKLTPTLDQQKILAKEFDCTEQFIGNLCKNVPNG